MANDDDAERLITYRQLSAIAERAKEYWDGLAKPYPDHLKVFLAWLKANCPEQQERDADPS